MYIGEVAKRTGATPKAIRLYESLGLLPAIAREGKYRVYTERHVELIQIVKQAQRLGFRLAEIKALFEEDVSCDIFPWAKAVILVKKKIKNNETEIARIEKDNLELAGFVKILEKNACE